MAQMNFEPEEEETLGYIIPLYVNSLIFGALVEAVASENGAQNGRRYNKDSACHTPSADFAVLEHLVPQG